MNQNQDSIDAFLTVTTVHQAEVAWWWAEAKLHDTAYQIKVNDSVAAKAKELERKYGVTDDISYCCQWEGLMLIGEHREQVAAAGRELVRHLRRFKGIVSLHSGRSRHHGDDTAIAMRHASH